MMFPRQVIPMFVALLACGVCAQAAPPRMMGFRYDGTGLFPPDCKPPTEFDGVAGKNLAWKVALPNHSNSSPIVVGGKVFVVCAAGWPEGQDCARLFCYDAATGKELWQRDLDEFATRPEAEAGEARAVRKEYYRRIRRINTLLFEYQSATDAQKTAILKEAAELGANKPESFERHSWGTGSAEQTVFNDREFSGKLKKVCGYEKITWSPLCLDVNMPTPVSDGRRVFVYTGRRTVHAFDLDGNALWNVWQADAPYNYHWPEDCANSPMIVDGLLLMYVFDHLWAYETDTGRLRYKTVSKVPHRHGMGHPVLLRLPLGGGKSEPALYLWTGDLVRVRDGKMLCESVAPLHCAALGGDGVDRVFLGISGGHADADGAAGDKRTWQFTDANQGGTLGVRFDLSGDKAKPEKLWFVPKNSGYKELGAYPIFLNDRLWLDSGHVVDAASGRALSSPTRRMNIGHNGFVLAGGHIYGVQQSGINTGSGGASGLGKQRDITLMCTVARLGDGKIESSRDCPIEFLPATITEPGKRAQVIALTGRVRYHDFYGWHTAYSAPFAAGNRLYIRTFDALYCFGEK